MNWEKEAEDGVIRKEETGNAKEDVYVVKEDMSEVEVTEEDRGDWGTLGHFFSYFVKYLDFEKQYACVTYHNLLTIHSAT